MRFAPLAANHLMGLVGDLTRRFPGRIFGTAQGHSSADHLAAKFAAIGLKPIGKRSAQRPEGAEMGARALPERDPKIGNDFFQTFTWEVGGERLGGKNVGGIIEGTDPILKNEFVIVTAHHDSQENTVQGANDNGSGCAGVLAIAEALAKNPPKRSVLFLTFDGEEGLRKNAHYHAGRRGSRYYAAHPIVPLAKTAMLINLDMIGQVHLESGSRKDVYQWASDDSFAQSILRRASEKALHPDENAIDGYPEQPRESQFFTTDAEPFYRLGVPTINFLSGRDLDNHHPNDDISRVIPARIEQYVRLAHQCTVDAANHPESLRDMGIIPGGLLPAFPLIRERKSAGIATIQEEQLRLDDLALRLPELKQASAKLATSVAKAHRIRSVSEPELAKIRERRDAKITELRGIPKSETEARRTLAAEIETLGAVVDVFAGAIYLSKINNTGNYYLQRIPEKLADLMRGAERLGIDAKLEGVVRKSDIEAFTADVTIDRAVFVARGSLGNLSAAIGQAVYAAWRPDAAAKSEPIAGVADARELRAQLIDRASEIAGHFDADEQQVKQIALVRAMLDAQLSGVRGTGDAWLARFARANMLTEFVDQVRALDTPDLIEKAEILEKEIDGDDLDALEKAVLEFYGALGEMALGRRFDSVDELSRLDRDRIDREISQTLTAIVHRTHDRMIESAADDPAVKQLTALSRLMEASLGFASLYKKDGGLKTPVTLRAVKDRLDDVRSAADHLQGAAKLQAEIRFWCDWLEPFVPLEAKAREQAKARTQIALEGIGILDRSQHGKKEIAPARQALVTLVGEPSPQAEKQLSSAVDQLGDPAMKSIRDRLRDLQSLDGAALGRAKGQRSGPLTILAMREEAR